MERTFLGRVVDLESWGRILQLLGPKLLIGAIHPKILHSERPRDEHGQLFSERQCSLISLSLFLYGLVQGSCS